jgi:hypothetical protein
MNTVSDKPIKAASKQTRFCSYIKKIITVCYITTKFTYTIKYIINTILHVSAIIVPSSGRNLLYAQNYCYIF